MALGLVGKKAGMTRVFTDDGRSVPVSVIEVLPNRITQIKTEESDGYRAVQVTTGTRRANRVTRPMAGHFAKAAVEAGRGVWEFRLDEGEALPRIEVAVPAEPGQEESKQVEGEEAGQSDNEAENAAAEEGQAAEPESAEAKTGDEIRVNLFSEGQIVDVTGISIGKGYAGTIKRHNFSSQRMTHGNSLSHRAPGSIGQNQSPGRVFKGKKMSGQLGNERTTVQNLQIIRVDKDRNLLFVKGGVPGSKNGNLIIKPAVKKS